MPQQSNAEFLILKGRLQAGSVFSPLVPRFNIDICYLKCGQRFSNTLFQCPSLCSVCCTGFINVL